MRKVQQNRSNQLIQAGFEPPPVDAAVLMEPAMTFQITPKLNPFFSSVIDACPVDVWGQDGAGYDELFETIGQRFEQFEALRQIECLRNFEGEFDRVVKR